MRSAPRSRRAGASTMAVFQRPPGSVHRMPPNQHHVLRDGADLLAPDLDGGRVLRKRPVADAERTRLREHNPHRLAAGPSASFCRRTRLHRLPGGLDALPMVAPSCLTASPGGVARGSQARAVPAFAQLAGARGQRVGLRERLVLRSSGLRVPRRRGISAISASSFTNEASMRDCSARRTAPSGRPPRPAPRSRPGGRSDAEQATAGSAIPASSRTARTYEQQRRRSDMGASYHPARAGDSAARDGSAMVPGGRRPCGFISSTARTSSSGTTSRCRRTRTSPAWTSVRCAASWARC